MLCAIFGLKYSSVLFFTLITSLGASQVIGHISLQKDIVLILILIFDFQKGNMFEDTHCKRAQTLKSHLNVVNVNLLSKTK